MALGDEIKKSKQEAIEFKEVLLALDSTLTSLAVNFQNGFGRGVEDQKKKLEALTRQYEKDIGRALQSNRKDISDIAEFQRQIEKGTLATGKAQSKLESIERKRLDCARRGRTRAPMVGRGCEGGEGIERRGPGAS